MFGRFSKGRIQFRSAIIAGAALAVAAPLAAHHSTAMFEWGKEIEMKGAVVEKWEWTNPHTFLYVRAKDKNGVEKRWAFEGMSPNHLIRYGWSKRSLEPGETIDLTYYPLRDGRNGGFNVTVSAPNTKKLYQFGERGSVQSASEKK